jgi:tripartite ATP-independent transporter DctM subunit
MGPILGAGGIAIMIPPSSLGVLLGSLAYIPVGKLLIAGIIPGLLMATLYTVYVVARCLLNPSLAPAYDCPQMPFSEKMIGFFKYVLPLGLIVFLVVGLIIMGIATPSESASMGVLGTFFLAWIYGGLNREILRKSLMGTFSVSTMVLMIIAGANFFSQLLSYTGAARGLVMFILGLKVSPILILIGMVVTLLILGCFMEQTCMMMISIPLFMPLVHALKFNPLWYGILVLLTLEIAATSPPFGLILFVMKGVVPEQTTMVEIYLAAFPYIVCDLLVLALIVFYPTIGLWLPSLL